jgi:hypothetical protein
VVLSRGARSGLLSAGQPPTADERQAQREVVLHYSADFKQRVSDGQQLAGMPADASAPLLLLRGGRQPLPPQPFPAPGPNDLMALLDEALKPRVLALLPFEGF